jgi:hypothetical protein
MPRLLCVTVLLLALATYADEKAPTPPITKEQCLESASPAGRANFPSYCYGILGKNLEVLRQCTSFKLAFDRPCAGVWTDVPLHLAASMSSEPMLELLIAGGADVRVTTSYRGHSLIHTAVIACVDRTDFLPRCVQLVKRLIALGLDLNARDKNGASVIWYLLDRPTIIAQLIPLGLDVNSSYNLIRPLDGAINRKNSETITVLKKHSAIEAGALARTANSIQDAITSLPNWHYGH